MKLDSYIKGKRHGREARELERLAMEDPFLAESLEGYELARDDRHDAALDRLRGRIARRSRGRRRTWQMGVWSTAALVLLCIGLSAYLVLITKPVVPTDIAQAVESAAGGDSLSGHVEDSTLQPDGKIIAQQTEVKKTAIPPASKEITHKHDNTVTDEVIIDETPVAVIEEKKIVEAAADAEVVVTGYGTAKKTELTGVRADADKIAAKSDSQETILTARATDVKIRGRSEKTVQALRKQQTEGWMADESAVSSPAEGEVYLIADQMPAFRGGDVDKFRDWLTGKILYTATAGADTTSVRPVLSFIVEKDGSLSDVQATHSQDELLAETILRVVKTSPRWTPGRNKGLPVRVRIIMPVDFRQPE